MLWDLRMITTVFGISWEILPIFQHKLAGSQCVAGLPLFLPSMWKFRDESSTHYGEYLCGGGWRGLCEHLLDDGVCLFTLETKNILTYHFSCHVCAFVCLLLMWTCLSYVLKALGSGYVCINVSLSVSITSHVGMHVCRRLGMKRQSYFCVCLILTDSEVVYGPRVKRVWSIYFYKRLYLFAARELKDSQAQHQMTVMSRQGAIKQLTSAW